MYRMKGVLLLTLPLAPTAEPNPRPGAGGGYVPDEGRATPNPAPSPDRRA